MPWPMSQDYNEAIQSPAANFADADLRRGDAVANALGIPMPYSGNFADVYQVRCPNGSRWAVKCFTREAKGLRERDLEISRHLLQVKLPFAVDFTYLDQGIRVAGKWYPILKMQWVEGLTLNQFVGKYADNPPTLESLLQIWRSMSLWLRSVKVGHCDLQHSNILLTPGATANVAGVEADRLRRHVGSGLDGEAVRGGRSPIVPAPSAGQRGSVQHRRGPLPDVADRHGAGRPEGRRPAAVGEVRQRRQSAFQGGRSVRPRAIPIVPGIAPPGRPGNRDVDGRRSQGVGGWIGIGSIAGRLIAGAPRSRGVSDPLRLPALPRRAANDGRSGRR